MPVMYKEGPTKCSDFIHSATFAYNTAVHAIPFILMYGREATKPQDMIKTSQKSQYDLP